MSHIVDIFICNNFMIPAIQIVYVCMEMGESREIVRELQIEEKNSRSEHNTIRSVFMLIFIFKMVQINKGRKHTHTHT